MYFIKRCVIVPCLMYRKIFFLVDLFRALCDYFSKNKMFSFFQAVKWSTVDVVGLGNAPGSSTIENYGKY